MRHLPLTLLAAATLGLGAQSVPSTINYQGRLTDNTPSQAPLNATVQMQFAIYDAASGGTRLWQEPAADNTGVSVTVTAGIFNYVLGSTAPLFPSPFTGATSVRYLQITLNPAAGAEILTPRQHITETGYASLAQNANNAVNATSAASAAALAANGTNCLAGNYSRGVDASGNAEGCTAAGTGTVTSVASGLGLTGGPITSAGTMSIDPAVVPQLGAANDFSATNSFTQTVDAPSLLARGAPLAMTQPIFAVQSNSGATTYLSVRVSGAIAWPGMATGNLTGTVTGNASTATALAANGANCPAGQFPLGVNASGATEGCTVAATGSVTGVTASAPLASSGGAAPVISLAGIVPVANGGTGSATKNFVDLTSDQAIGGIKNFYGGVSVGIFLDWTAAGPANGDIYGNAGTANALLVNGTNCPAGQHPLGTDASGNAEGCSLEAGATRVPAPAPAVLTTLDSAGTVGINSSITIGADGLGLIAYYDNTNSSLKTAHCSNAACSSATLTTVDTIGSNGVGQQISITIGADGLGLISYYDTPNGDLKVAHCANTACSSVSPATIDTTGDVGSYSSITIGADGLGLISYYDTTNSALKVAHCLNSACSAASPATLDSAGVVGADTSIALGSDGFGLISYYDTTNTALKVAHCSNLACNLATLITLDTTGSVGLNSSIVIGADGLGLISYQDSTNADLKVAHCSDEICNVAVVSSLDPSVNSGAASAVTIGADGLGMIAYYDTTNFDLKAAHCQNPACSAATLVTLDSAGTVGSACMITTGADGLPLFSYYDVTGTALKTAHCSNAFCVPHFRRR